MDNVDLRFMGMAMRGDGSFHVRPNVATSVGMRAC